MTPLWSEIRTNGVEAGDAHLVLAPADSPGRVLGSPFPTGTPPGYAFSPDGATAILSYTNGVIQFFDVGTGQLKATAKGIASYASWQRLAPQGDRIYAVVATASFALQPSRPAARVPYCAMMERSTGTPCHP